MINAFSRRRFSRRPFSTWGMRAISLLVLSLTLAACGKGGGGGTPAPPPSPPDESNPSIELQSPAAGSIITDVTTLLKFIFGDQGSGLDMSSLKITANGADITSLVKQSEEEENTWVLSPDLAHYWKPGDLEIVVEIQDKAGNRSRAVFSFVVQPTTAALPFAQPTSGFAPLNVTFFPFNTTDTAIENYQWDFDNDGQFDINETVGRNQQYTFTEPGSYPVTLKLTDSQGNEAEGQVVIEVKNAPPEVEAEATPSNGPVPLQVYFNVTASDNEGIAKYEWDFDGDGTYDQESTDSGDESYQYTRRGLYRPVLRVTDELGESTVYTVPNIEVRASPPGSPTVTLNAYPAEGFVPLNVGFNAYATDPDGNSFVKWEWDYDGDGKYDESFDSQSSVNHNYEAPGVYYARVRATAADGGSNVDVVRIIVKPSITLNIETDTFDPANGDTASLKTTLGGTTEMRVVVEDRYGRTVRTLRSMQAWDAGDYTDTWDGTDDDGVLQPEGDYRVVVIYRFDGKEERYDRSLSTGGNSYNPSRTNIPSSFAPLAGEPLNIEFTLDQPAEVTAFIGRFNEDTRLITFMQRRPLGTGTHNIIWNGEDASGKMIHPPEGDSFLFGIFAYTLPDNTIYLRSGAHIENLTVSPSILVPVSVGDTKGRQASKLNFSLNKAADIRLLVYNADSGGIVYRASFEDMSAGEQTITWDGKDDQGNYVKPGRYRLGLTAIDGNGFQSITRYVVQQVYY